MSGNRLIDGLRVAVALGEKGDLPSERLIPLLVEWAQSQSETLEEFIRSQGSDPFATVPFVQTESEDSDTFQTDLSPAPVSNAADRMQSGMETGLAQSSNPLLERRFRLLKKHSQGGLGIVFLARDEHINREVALKQIRSDRQLGPIQQEKFMIEAEMTGQLEHPGIVPIYALGKDAKGNPYYAMKFIRGVDLRSSIDLLHDAGGGKPVDYDGIPFRQMLRRFLDVCNTMEYAHSRGILHRDLKPANIMLGSHGETLVVDWGLAKLMSVESTQTDSDNVASHMLMPPVQIRSSSGRNETQYGSFCGTIAYAPPEQLLGQVDRLCPASDIYSLGAILFEILTNQAPIRTAPKSLHDLAETIRGGEVTNPRRIHPRIPLALAMICQRALSYEISDRFANVREFADDLERWLADERVLTLGSNEPAMDKLGRLLRRYRSWTAPTVAAIALTTAIAVLSAILINRARVNEHVAKQKAIEYKKDAVGRIGIARNAIDTLLLGTKEYLAEIPGSEDLRLQLLETASQEYQRLGNSQSSDPELELERLRALVRVADIQTLQDDLEGASTTYQAAIRSLLAREEEFRKSNRDLAVAWRTEIAKTLGRRGLMLAEKPESQQEAKSHYDQSYQRFVDLEQEYGEDSTVRLAFAKLKINYGNFLANHGDVAFASALLKGAIDDYSDPAMGQEWNHQVVRCQAKESLARLMISKGASQEAIVLLNEAIDEIRATQQANPNEREPLLALASVKMSMAVLYRDDGDLDASLIKLREAAQTYESLRSRWPGNVLYHELFAITGLDIGLLLIDLGKFSEAIEILQKAELIIDDLIGVYPSVARFQRLAASVRSGLGQAKSRVDEDPAPSLALLQASQSLQEELVKLFDGAPDECFLLANAQSQLGQAYIRAQQFQEAEKQFRDSISMYEELVASNSDRIEYSIALSDVQWRMGILLYSVGRLSEANVYLSDSITSSKQLALRAPTKPSLRLRCAERLMRCPDEGLISFADAEAQIRALSPTAFKNDRLTLAQAELSVRTGDPKTALELLQPILEKPGGPSKSAYFVQAFALRELGDDQAADESLTKCRELVKIEGPYDWEFDQLLLTIPPARSEQ